MKLDHKAKKARVSMRAKELLDQLTVPEREGQKGLTALWRPEYASYMVEGTPGKGRKHYS